MKVSRCLVYQCAQYCMRASETDKTSDEVLNLIRKVSAIIKLRKAR